MAHIEELRDVIHHLHGAKAHHLGSVPVTETIQGQTVWDGMVEVFRLTGHPQANKVYAWIHATDDPAHPKRHVTVLHIPPATSPQTTVQAAIVHKARGHASLN